MRKMKEFVNDSNYKVSPKVDGVQIVCPFYKVWRAMCYRVSSAKTKTVQPTYRGVDCCDEWLSFMKFRSWMIGQKWEGMQLDKDILVRGNKVYAPDTCAFVPSKINKLFIESNAKRGNWAIGVYKMNKPDDMVNEYKKPFVAQLRKECLGTFETEEEAHAAWQKGKELKIRSVANEWKNSNDQSFRDDVFRAILDRADILKRDRENGVITISLN